MKHENIFFGKVNHQRKCSCKMLMFVLIPLVALEIKLKDQDRVKVCFRGWHVWIHLDHGWRRTPSRLFTACRSYRGRRPDPATHSISLQVVMDQVPERHPWAHNPSHSSCSHFHGLSFVGALVLCGLVIASKQSPREMSSWVNLQRTSGCFFLGQHLPHFHFLSCCWNKYQQTNKPINTAADTEIKVTWF